MSLLHEVFVDAYKIMSKEGECHLVIIYLKEDGTFSMDSTVTRDGLMAVLSHALDMVAENHPDAKETHSLNAARDN